MCSLMTIAMSNYYQQLVNLSMMIYIIEAFQIQATEKTAMNRSSGSASGSAYVPNIVC